ncbi:MAG: YpdA family putative bacillithiol disulfide reductase [Ignavibacteriales bacterium]|nr:YpdA family putative bacillithiol disulfide reductase [Ignavibacteriales bacterium]
MGNKIYDILVIGAGPSGLSCAIEAKKKGFSCVVLDKGSLTDAIRRFPVNMTFFSTPELLEIGTVPFVSSGFRPTRLEALRYYQSVAKFYGLSIQSGEQVASIEKKDALFNVQTNQNRYDTSNVVIATGYFDNPNPYEVPGANLPKVLRYYSEPFEYVGREVAIVGGKNSAVEIALDLFRNGAKVTLIHRGSKLTEGVKYWILPDIENRIKAGEIKALFETQVKEIREHSLVLDGKYAREIPNDFVFVMIGYRPDNKLLVNAGVHIDENSLAPLHNPETMETNIKGLFVAGSIAAGKFNNKIFIENGRAHGKLIVDTIEKAH